MSQAVLKAAISLDRTAFTRGLQGAVAESKVGSKAIASATSSNIRSGFANAFRGAIADSRNAATQMVRAASSIIKTGISTAMTGGAVVGGAAFLSGGVALGKSITAAMDMETMQTQFSTLLGSAGAAKTRIKELIDFASSTPFEVPEVVAASRQLEVMAGKALSTGKGLRLVGDVASGVGIPFQESAFWIGRLYDALQSGRPAGEAMMRLQELGAISGKARNQIEALSESGQGMAAWKLAEGSLGRFQGGMEKLSDTLAGRLSNLQDAVGSIWRAIGEPLNESLKPLVSAASGLIGDLQVKAKEFGNYLATGVNTAVELFKAGDLGTFLKDKLISGLATVGNYATGLISSSITFLADALVNGALIPGMKILGLLMVDSGMRFGAAILRGLDPVWKDLADMLSKIDKYSRWVDPTALFDGQGLMGDASDSLKPVFKGGASGFRRAAVAAEENSYASQIALKDEIGKLTDTLANSFSNARANFAPSTAFSMYGDPARMNSDYLWDRASKGRPAAAPEFTGTANYAGILPDVAKKIAEATGPDRELQNAMKSTLDQILGVLGGARP